MTKITKTLVRVSPLGVIVSTILIAGCLAPAGARGENAGAAVNNMNDAARAAAVAAAGKRVTPKDYARMSHHSRLAAANGGVARNNMNDAARAAIVRAAAANAGVADNNMSDAARAATVAAGQTKR